MSIYPDGIRVKHFYGETGKGFIAASDSDHPKETWEHFEKENYIYDIKFTENAYGAHILVVYLPIYIPKNR